MLTDPGAIGVTKEEAAAPIPPPDAVTLFDDGIRLPQERLEALATYLGDEIRRSEQDTEKFRRNVILWRDFVDPEDKPKDFPWPNASNVFVPIPRIVLDALKASIKQTITRQKEMWVAEIVSRADAGLPDPTDPQAAGLEHETRRAFVAAAEKFTTDPGYLKFKTFLDHWLDEMLTTGIGPVKQIREPLQRKVFVKDPSASAGSKAVSLQTITLRRGPQWLVVPVGTWVRPSGIWTSIQEMPWCGNWTILTPATLQQRASAPWNYRFVPDVQKGGVENTGEIPDMDQRLAKIGQSPTQLPGYRIYELYLDWDLYGRGELHSIVVSYSLKANRILRIAYTDGWKPYDQEVASVRGGTIDGRGIIEPIVQPCRGINTAINQTFDSQTLSNAACLRYPEDSTVGEILAQHGGFFPGMGLPYKEDVNEISILEFPKPDASSFIVVNFFQQIIERLTRIGPARLGDISEGRRTPATLGLATQQIGAEAIDELMDRVRDTAGRLMSRYFILIYLDDPGVFTRILGEEKGSLVTEVVKRSLTARRSLEEAVRIRLTASSSSRSVELEQQNAMATAQLTMGWQKSVIELVQLYTQTPEGPPRRILLDIMRSSEEQMRRLVELANQPDSRLIIPEIWQRMQEIPPPAPPPPAPGPGAVGAIPPELAAHLGGMGAAAASGGPPGAPGA